MGQKTDARIFRQGIHKKNWEIKYIENNNEESSLFLYKTLQIQKYLNRFFGLYKMKIHHSKIFYSDTSLQIFLSFYVTTKTFHTISKDLTKYSKKWLATFKPVFSKKHRKKRRHLRKRMNFKKMKKVCFPYLGKSIRLKKALLFQKKKIRKKKVSRSNKIRNFEIKKNQKILIKKNKSLVKFKPYSTSGLKEFQEILIKSLKAYTNNKIHIFLTLQNLNRYKILSKGQIENLQRIFKQLRNFVKNAFFKEAINILFISISRRKSAKILASFISDQLRLNQLRTNQATILRKDNYFLGFLKQILVLLIKSEMACIIGIKITIKGRFNRAPRARISNIRFGKFATQSFNSKIDYEQSTAYTVNGTFGVKVWLCENNF